MGLQVHMLIILGLGTILTLIWLLLLLGDRYTQFIEPLNSKSFPGKELYPIGFRFLEVIGYQYQSKKDRALRQQIEILHGKKYTEYYLRVITAQQISMSMTVLVLFIPFFALTNEIIVLLIGLLFVFLSYYYFSTAPREAIKKRSNEIMGDFPSVVAKLALLTNAGMIIREAWEEVAYSGEGTLYKEMQITVDEIRNGVSETEAYYQFGFRCVVPEVKKFTTTLTQAMGKGNREIADTLKLQSSEVWEMRKHHVKQQGEKASGKLLIPMVIMFLGVIIMIVIPIFTNIGL